MKRRAFLQNTLLAGSAVAWSALLPSWARSQGMTPLAGVPGLQGNQFDLRVAAERAPIAGRRARHVRLNGQFPAPLLRWRAGDTVTLRVANTLDEPTSIHWHGLLLPWHMDGVPGVSFDGIAPGSSFTYQFPLRQAGTYWYHSHSGLQEQLGHYGPIIIDPSEPEPFGYDREYIILLSDWSHESPERIFRKLKTMGQSYNFQQRTLGDFVRDARQFGVSAALKERADWGDMRMNRTDLADVTAATYTYLVNGHSPDENWTGLFRPGERLRLRFINAASMSLFNVRIPGLPMTVVQADGLDVEPVETDEFQIGAAETFDVLVQPLEDAAFTIYAESNDFFGHARATLAPRPGMEGPLPPRRPRPLLSMKDMGMEHAAAGHSELDHNGMDHTGMQPEVSEPAAVDHSTMDHSTMDHSTMDHSTMDHSTMDHSTMDHSTMDHSTMDHAGMDHEATVPLQAAASATAGPQTHLHARGPGVASLATAPVSRLHERPLGLEQEPHRVLVYADLRSLQPNPDRRAPGRTLELHLTANMERYMWSFDGLKYSEVTGPVPLQLGERLRLVFVNDTMMPHPLHLHGMFFDVVTGEHDHKPRKHTLVLKAGEKAAVDLTVSEPGDWAFHCHLLYHMQAGMMRVFRVGSAVLP